MQPRKVTRGDRGRVTYKPSWEDSTGRSSWSPEEGRALSAERDDAMNWELDTVTKHGGRTCATDRWRGNILPL